MPHHLGRGPAVPAIAVALSGGFDVPVTTIDFSMIVPNESADIICSVHRSRAVAVPYVTIIVIIIGIFIYLIVKSHESANEFRSVNRSRTVAVRYFPEIDSHETTYLVNSGRHPRAVAVPYHTIAVSNESAHILGTVHITVAEALRNRSIFVGSHESAHILGTVHVTVAEAV